MTRTPIPFLDQIPVSNTANPAFRPPGPFGQTEMLTKSRHLHRQRAIGIENK